MPPSYNQLYDGRAEQAEKEMIKYSNFLKLYKNIIYERKIEAPANR